MQTAAQYLILRGLQWIGQCGFEKKPVPHTQRGFGTLVWFGTIQILTILASIAEEQHKF